MGPQGEGARQTGFLTRSQGEVIHSFIHSLIFIEAKCPGLGIIKMTAPANIYSAVSECLPEILFPWGLPTAGSYSPPSRLTAALPHHPSENRQLLRFPIPPLFFCKALIPVLPTICLISLYSICPHGQASSSTLFRLKQCLSQLVLSDPYEVGNIMKPIFQIRKMGPRGV